MFSRRATTSWCHNEAINRCPRTVGCAGVRKGDSIMSDVSRRKFLGLTAAAPLRLQQLHLPNLPLISHEGKRVLFYDDLVKNKVVTFNFFFANCDEICPLVTANMAKVQKLMGKQVGRDIHMYSFTLKPEEDTVEVIRKYRQKYGIGPGWSFFTAKPADMEKLRVAIGFTYPDPVIDADKTQHIGNIRYGNEPLMYWSACPGMAKPGWVAETLELMIHPDGSRVLVP